MLVDGPVFERVCRGVDSMVVERMEVCRGVDRLRIPDSNVDRKDIPLRITIIRHRETGESEVLGPAENWVSLPKTRQVRKGKPAKMRLTLFGKPLDDPRNPRKNQRV